MDDDSALLRGPAHTACGYHAESCILHSGIPAQRCLGRAPRDLGSLPAFERKLEISVLRQYDLQDAFYEVGYDASAFDSIPVPSVWQNHGYDHHQYTNIRYPFPADPPYVPKENPCGAYLYDFTYQKDAAAPRAFLNFEGVASCFYVWLNGQFVGYSQVAHSTSEFDVTKFLQDGTNHLAVLVLKWCDGSYMEDQDMFRMNGIFRDVYLLHRPEQCIEDYFITTDIHGSTAEVAVRLRYYDSAVATRITLYDAAGTMVGSVTPVEAPDDAEALMVFLKMNFSYLKEE